MALTFTPTGNGVTATQVTTAITTMAIFRRVLPATNLIIQVAEDDVADDFVSILGTRDAINAGEAPEALNVAIPLGWYIRIKANGFDGSPQVVIG